MVNKETADILTIGGGFAGLVSAIHLSKAGLSVILIEKNEYPRHKICSKFISNEVLPYLQYLDADPLTIGAKKNHSAFIKHCKGKIVFLHSPT